MPNTNQPMTQPNGVGITPASLASQVYDRGEPITVEQLHALHAVEPDSTEQRTQFDYLLNAFEAASQSKEPAVHDYAGKRAALFVYVRNLEGSIPDQIKRAVEAEREACSLIAEDATLPAYEDCGSWREYGSQTCMSIAAAIRARGDTK